MTITFHPYAGSRRIDGTRLLFVRVTFKRTSRKIATTITCHPEDVSRSGKVKSPAVLNKYEAIVRQMRDAVSQLNAFALDEMDVDDVVAHVRRVLSVRSFRLDFIAFGMEEAKKMSPGARAFYVTALNSLRTFCDARGIASLDVNDISKPLLLDYREWAAARPRGEANCKTATPSRDGSDATAVRHLNKLATIHRLAKDRFNDEDAGVILIPRSPFSTLKLTPPPAVGQAQSNLGVALVQRIISARPDDADELLALSAFVLSFGLMGANMADLYEAKPPRDGVLEYNRKKTRTRRDDKAQMQVAVDARLSPFIARLSSGRSKCWLDKLRARINPGEVTHFVNRHLRAWAEREGVRTFTFYAARKSWASIARNNAGVDKATVDECLCHRGDLRLADIYIERDWSLLWRANAAVLDLFSWE